MSISRLFKFNLPTKEKKTTMELSMSSSRRCEALLATRPEPRFLFLRVTCQSECFPVHQSPATRKKLPGSAWPLKLPMTYTAYKKVNQSIHVGGRLQKHQCSAQTQENIYLLNDKWILCMCYVSKIFFLPPLSVKYF